MNPFSLPARLSRLQIEITTACNLKCRACQRTIAMAEGNWRNAHMPVERFEKVLANCPPSDVLVLQGIGEPTLHPHLDRLIAIARAGGRHPVISFNTNALVHGLDFYLGLKAAGLSHVSISVDSLDQDGAEDLRKGTDAAELREAVAALCGGLGLPITVSIVLSRRNLPTLAGLVATLAGMGVRVIEIQPVIDYTGGSPDLLSAAEMTQASRLVEQARRAHPGLTLITAAAMNPNGAKCRRPLHAGYVTVDGSLTPCCTTNDRSLFGGVNIETTPFATAWRSPGVSAWMSQFLDGEPEICRGCSFNPSGKGPSAPEALERATTLIRGGALAQAQAMLEAVAGGPDRAEALHLLGVVALESGEPVRAAALLSASVELAPTPRSRNNLGVALTRSGRADEAERVLRQLLADEPGYPAAYQSLAALLDDNGNPAGAAAILIDLAERAAAIGRLDIAAGAVDRLLAQRELHPGLTLLAHRIRLAGGQDLALRIHDRLLARDPDDLGHQLGRCMALLPVAYTSAAQVAQCRAAYLDALERLGEAVAGADAARLAQGAAQVGLAKPFYLSYQGFDDCQPQRIYGGAVSAMIAARSPLREPAAKRSGGRLRIGFATAYFNLHSVSKLFGGWVRGLDRQRFEVIGYNLHTGEPDETGRALMAACDHIRYGLGSAEAWAAAMAADGLDALIYPEIGMESQALRLAAERLAPVQCVAWGHPVTTGLTNMDYFLSSELMEPEDGDSHYTETLVRLPNLSVCYEPMPDPVGPPVTRGELGLDPDAVVYVCCQSLFKYRPCDDWVFPAILGQVPGAQALFIGVRGTPLADIFLHRLEQAFVAARVPFAGRVVMVPPVAPERFPSLLRAGDVYLDSLGWSGGNTTLEAATNGLPIVTMAGDLMRARHSAGIMTRMGLGDRVAATEAGYVAEAIALGQDRAARDAAAAEIRARHHRLYHDQQPVRALEDFLARAIG